MSLRKELEIFVGAISEHTEKKKNLQALQRIFKKYAIKEGTCQFCGQSLPDVTEK